MIKAQEFISIVRDCSYKDGWEIGIYLDKDRPYIQLTVEGTDSVTGEPCTWKSGKRWLSDHMCKQEVVGVVFGLIKDAEMHELHEWFRYKGSSIYNPHLDPDALAELASKKSSFIMRDNPMSMEET